jgi:hypothetical protein
VRKFKAMVEGKNLLLKMERVSSDEERIAKHGVLILRYVEAIDETVAAHTALENFRYEPKGKELQDSLLNTSDDPPVFSVSEVTELESFEGLVNLNPGLIFYPEEKKKQE